MYSVKAAKGCFHLEIIRVDTSLTGIVIMRASSLTYAASYLPIYSKPLRRDRNMVVVYLLPLGGNHKVDNIFPIHFPTHACIS